MITYVRMTQRHRLTRTCRMRYASGAPVSVCGRLQRVLCILQVLAIPMLVVDGSSNCSLNAGGCETASTGSLMTPGARLPPDAFRGMPCGRGLVRRWLPLRKAHPPCACTCSWSRACPVLSGMVFSWCRCDCRVPMAAQPSLCQPQDLLRILNANEDLYAHKKGSLVLLLGGRMPAVYGAVLGVRVGMTCLLHTRSGTDKPHLHQALPFAEQLLASGWFHRVFWEANTVDMAGIDTYLKGLDYHYMLGREEAFVQAVLDADLDKKQYLALGAWGGRMTCRTCLTGDAATLEEMIEHEELLFSEEVASGTNASAVPWLQRKRLEPLDYFAELSKYKFMIAPYGRGIQSPKFLEALMVMTIPVTRKFQCFQQLQQYGMPIVLVEDWDDITPAFLEQEWEKYKGVIGRSRWIGTVDGVESLYYQQC
eukprot:scaffold276_cov548-Prasinococcus_capsulatus_cf.AAC.27